MGIHGSQGLGVDSVLHELRQRADEDFLEPSARLGGARRGGLPPGQHSPAFPPASEHEGGRHQVDLPEMELRVSLTRSRYPNTPDGEDCYAVTISRLAMDHEPEEAQCRRVLFALFG